MGESKSKKTIVTVPPAVRNNPAESGERRTSRAPAATQVTYGMKQYRFVLIGLALLVIGFFLMSGGYMPNPDTWDESLIYGFRRTVAAPIFILAGLVMQVWAIFKV